MFQKNHVGRPSNEEVKRKKAQKILLVSIPIIGVLVLALAINKGGLSGLMGDATSNYYCDEGAKLQGDTCVITQNARLLGDVNGDKKINVKDATAIQKYLSGSNSLDLWKIVAADVNKDGDISIKDVTLIQKSIAKMTSTSGSNSKNLLYDEEYVCPNGWVKKGTLCTFTTNAYRKEPSEDDWTVGGEGFTNLQIKPVNVSPGEKVYVDFYGGDFDSVSISMVSTSNHGFIAYLHDLDTNYPYFVVPDDAALNEIYDLKQVFIFKGNEVKSYTTDPAGSDPYMNPGENHYIFIR